MPIGDYAKQLLEGEMSEVAAFQAWIGGLDLSQGKQYLVVGVDFLETRGLAQVCSTTRFLEMGPYRVTTNRIITKEKAVIHFYAAANYQRMRGLRVDGVWVSRRTQQYAAQEIQALIAATLKPEARMAQDADSRT